jgi:hypothetical protein
MTGAPLIIPLADIDCCESIVPPPAPDDATIVTNDGWFPDIALGDFREEMRIRDSVTVPRQRKAVRDAIIAVSNDLVDWAAKQVAAGHASLAAVPAPRVDGESRLALSYRSAVFARAKADLVERYRDIDITDSGNRRAEDLDASIGELRRDAIHAVRDILGVTRTTVDLI